MGSVTSLRKASAAGEHAAQRLPDQRETTQHPSDDSEMPSEGPISLAAALGSIMLSLEADHALSQRSGS